MSLLSAQASVVKTPEVIKGLGKVQKAGNAGKENALTKTFELQMKAYHIVPELQEFKFHPTRRWEFDYAWPSLKVAVEVNGGSSYSSHKVIRDKKGVVRVVPSSRHISPEGYRKDREKVNEAQALGWKVYEFDAEHVRTGFAIDWLRKNVFLSENLSTL